MLFLYYPVLGFLAMFAEFIAVVAYTLYEQEFKYI
jgi:hypothetical protein